MAGPGPRAGWAAPELGRRLELEVSERNVETWGGEGLPQPEGFKSPSPGGVPWIFPSALRRRTEGNQGGWWGSRGNTAVPLCGSSHGFIFRRRALDPAMGSGCPFREWCPCVTSRRRLIQHRRDSCGCLVQRGSPQG